MLSEQPGSRRTLSFLAAELLEALHDDIAIERVQLLPQAALLGLWPKAHRCCHKLADTRRDATKEQMAARGRWQRWKIDRKPVNDPEAQILAGFRLAISSAFSSNRNN